MSALYFMNYIVFALFFTLLMVEAGIAVLSLISYSRDRDRIRSYIMPLWEIIGTFAVFYFVEFEATYPSLLTLLGTAYIIPIIVAALFFILRNAFISYSEYVGKGKQESLYIRIYGVSTLVVAFLVVSILASGVSGIGVNQQQMGINVLALLLNQFNITLFVAVALIGWFAASVILRLSWATIPSAFGAVVGINLVFVSLFSSVPYMAAAVHSAILPVVISLALFVATLALYYRRSRYARYLVFAWLFSGILAYGILQYPFMFGGTLNTNAYAATGAGAVYLVITTAIGGIFLVAALGYLIYLRQVRISRPQTDY